MSLPKLPPSIEMDADTKKAVIVALKQVLGRLQDKGLISKGLTYADLISKPHVLQGFIATFDANRAIVDDLVKGKDGKPVRNDDQNLICNISLAQICQLLVRTCARKVFEADKSLQTVTETRTKSLIFGLIKRNETVEVQKHCLDPVEERKLRELTQYLAFPWQLPLLHAYRHHITYQQVTELGDNLLALRTPEAVEAVGQFDPHILRKVAQASGPDFVEILLERPEAIAGVAVWNADMYEFFRNLLGKDSWAFFARDKSFFNVVASIDKSFARVYGDTLCFIAAENLEEMQRLNIDKCEILVTSLRQALGDKLSVILGHPGFAKAILRRVVDNLLHMGQDKEKLMVSFSLTCKAMVPTVMDWYSKQRAEV